MANDYQGVARMKKIPSQPFRLGFGEVEDAMRTQSGYDARSRLLSAIRSIKPQVLDDLAGEPLAAYQSATASFGRQGMPAGWGWDTLAIYADDEEWGEIFVPLRDALDKWFRRWNLRQCEPWCSAVTLQTLDTWERSPAWLESRQWAHEYGGFLATRAEERASL
jgi:hypothetical protein